MLCPIDPIFGPAERAENELDITKEPLGDGCYGTVYGGTIRKTGRKVAIKVICKERLLEKATGASSLRSEISIMQKISHAGIVRLESAFQTSGEICIVMEKMAGDMREMIMAAGRLDERCTKFLSWQILSAIKYLHDKCIAHCDLKPDNILISQRDILFPQTKLCDFGHAQYIGEGQIRKTVVGTDEYCPPEVLPRTGYNRSIDMWSFGVIIYITLTGLFPFPSEEEKTSKVDDESFLFSCDIWSEISPDARDLIRRLLRVDINQRLSADESLANT